MTDNKCYEINLILDDFKDSFDKSTKINNLILSLERENAEIFIDEIDTLNIMLKYTEKLSKLTEKIKKTLYSNMY